MASRRAANQNAKDDAFTAFAAARGPVLRRTAYLLCGNWHAAEDLTQTALTKLYLHWGRLVRHDELDGYARTVLLRAYLDERRLRRSTEVLTADAPELPARDGTPDLRLVILQALAQVTPRQRAVLVLRYWEDQDVATTARLLGCSEGTVKSTAARGLEALRKVLVAAGVLVSIGGEIDVWA